MLIRFIRNEYRRAGQVSKDWQAILISNTNKHPRFILIVMKGLFFTFQCISHCFSKKRVFINFLGPGVLCHMTDDIHRRLNFFPAWLSEIINLLQLVQCFLTDDSIIRKHDSQKLLMLFVNISLTRNMKVCPRTEEVNQVVFTTTTFNFHTTLAGKSIKVHFQLVSDYLLDY